MARGNGLGASTRSGRHPRWLTGMATIVVAAAIASGCSVLTTGAVVTPTPDPSTSTAATPTPSPSRSSTRTPSPPGLPGRRGLHEVRYYAGSTTPTADIEVRRSSGQMDTQTDLAMPLESQSGNPYLMVRLPAGSEAIIRLTAPSPTAEVWCSLMVDGAIRESTREAGDTESTTCRFVIPEDPAGTSPTAPTDPDSPWETETPEPTPSTEGNEIAA